MQQITGGFWGTVMILCVSPVSWVDMVYLVLFDLILRIGSELRWN